MRPSAALALAVALAAAAPPVAEAATTGPLIEAVRVRNSRITFVGAVPGPSIAVERLELAAAAPDGPLRLAVTGSWDGAPLRLAATLGRRAELLDPIAPLRIPDLTLRVGDSDVAGTLALDRSGARPRLEGDLVATRFDLAGEGAAGDGGGGGDDGSGRVFPDAPLNLAPLHALDAAIRFRAAAVGLPGAALEELDLTLALQDGVLTVAPLRAALGRARPEGRLVLDAAADPPALALALDAQGVDVAPLLAGTGIGGMVEGAADITLDVAGRGGSPAAIMASLAGRADLLMTDGRLRGRLVRQAAGLGQLAGALLARDAGDWTRLNCVAARFAIRDGVAEAEALLLDTDFSTALGQGRIDLGRETLDLVVAPRPKGVRLAVGVPVRIRGTLAAPRFGLDEGGAAAGLIAGLAGALLGPRGGESALAGLGAEAAPCVAVAESAAAAPPARDAPAIVPPGIVPPPDELGRALEGLGRGLEGLLGGRRR
ncbi:MAG TPA: AsmA family protein [Geminicoccaceae bacterium]|nr:AsmA family protein [Geminicoccaceae bacterium]